MRLVHQGGAGQLEINWQWLPTWIGMNVAVLAELDQKMSAVLVGKPLTSEVLEEAHYAVLDHLKEKFPNIDGLWDYIDAMKLVTI